MRKITLDLSVHQLVDFLLRKGDIDNRVFNRTTMNEGTLLHALYQAKQGDNYLSEYPLKTSITIDEVTINIQGRADGVIVKGNSYTIDEIKTSSVDIKIFKEQNLEWHLGQAKVYAYMLALEKELKEVNIKMTYISQSDRHDKIIDYYSFLYSELERFVYDLLNEYLMFYNIILRLEEKRNASIKTLEFPFTTYRKGQKEMMKYAYGIASKGGSLFVEAPTGIGKTMSTLFPFIKALNEDEKGKIFYLTAKSSGKLNARKAIQILKEKGLSLIDILITAKEKICPLKERNCNPDECPYARGYYNKINDVIKEALMLFNSFDFDTIKSISEVHQVCPFELELDLSLFSDVIICDYNYMFDPLSYMKRYFDEDSSHYLALVDEAHNLISRSRDMYSASFSYSDYLKVKQSLRKVANKKLKLALSKFGKIFDAYLDLPLKENEYPDLSPIDFKIIDRFITYYQSLEEEDKQGITKEYKDFYLDIFTFHKIYSYFDETFLFYIDKKENDIIFKIISLDTSQFVKSIVSRLKGAIFFSATLSPMDYYVNSLGGNKETPTLSLASPFPKENFHLLIAPKVSVKYKNREQSLPEVRNYIKTFISQKVGNYFVYFPSYEYQEMFLKDFPEMEGIHYHIQDKDMNELQREDFLNNFIPEPKETHVGFVIIGGAFGEGVDLVSDRLIGVAIIGIGLSKINYESDKIASYYEEMLSQGYLYAYLYPGMNKVMQAVGRLIRSESDRGSALLVDERYMHHAYRSLFKKEWEHYEVVLSKDDLEESLQKFENK